VERAFASDPVAVYAFVEQFFGALAGGGMQHVVLSPGSRSTPLAIAAGRTAGLRTWVQLDERCAAFFALGVAKASGQAVALVCTSGTAAANYLPAIAEAHHARTPLLVLTADRPPELRDWGAGQTIDQTGLYGRYPRWAAEVPIPMRGEDALRYARRLAARAMDEAMGFSAGPVHLNWPFREPLEPLAAPAARGASGVSGPPGASGVLSAAGASGGPIEVPEPLADEDPGLRFSHARPEARGEDVEELLERVRRYERGILCVGPLDVGDEQRAEWTEAVRAFARASGWPVLADPASGLRAGGSAAPVLTFGDAITRAPGFASRMRPEIVLRLGDTPVSKAQRLWLEAASPDEVWWLDEGGQWGEPSHRATRVVRGGSASLLAAVARALPGPLRSTSAWLRGFERAEAAAREALDAFLEADLRDSGLSGLALVRRLAAALPAGGRLFASNSMSIRLLDLAFPARPDPIRVLVNRGASGIDGITSTALGVAATSAPGQRTLLLTGDLAFLHDLGGLWLAARETLDLTIVVLDDDGGGIFSFLPVARQGAAGDFDRLFTTPHGLDLSRAAALFGLEGVRVESDAGLAAALERSFATPGVSILHVPVDPKRNEAAFRAALACLVDAVDAVDSIDAVGPTEPSETAPGPKGSEGTT
jgi:2-succinyl-5-enolpyruvyl-6-hydroxy-3-cyclohexene-1-carboxylate synthase